jgi:hypothetical protein
VSATSTIDEYTQTQTRAMGSRTNPLRSTPAGASVTVHRGMGQSIQSIERTALLNPSIAPAIVRQSGQLPAFAPLLEELELAGWSSNRRNLSGNFHDWLMLEGREILVAVGQVVGAELIDPTEAALVAQAAWATIRAHAHYVRDAGDLLTRAARSLWPMPNAAVQASVAVALLDTAEGRGNVAMAGNCLAWRVRAAASEQLAIRQPLLGGAADFTYASQSVQLSLRERLLLVADNPLRRPPKLALSIAGSFARLDAESHRRMMAADAIAIVRRHYEQVAEELRSPASIVAVRRR